MTDLIQGSYVTAKKFYTEHNGKEYFEFHFPYVSKDQTFRELDRFLWESKHEMTRFRNRYEGPVLIDLTEWNRHGRNEYFDAFMYFLLDNPSVKQTFILQEPCSTELMETLKSFFEIKVTELEIKKTPDAKRRIGFYTEEEDLNHV